MDRLFSVRLLELPGRHALTGAAEAEASPGPLADRFAQGVGAC